MLSIQRILVAVDFSDVSQREIDYALSLAEKVGARVTVLHAYHLPFYSVSDGMVFPTAEQAERVMEAAQKALEAALAQTRERGVAVDGLLREGHPSEQIVAVAEEIGADLIIVGTHGHGAIKHALLGGIALDVIRIAKAPVLTIHSIHGTTR